MTGVVSHPPFSGVVGWRIKMTAGARKPVTRNPFALAGHPLSGRTLRHSGRHRMPEFPCAKRI
ncbi:MAG: hypothetical protein ACFB15_27205 [Cyclobacteriaceae bacterium]